MGEAAHYHHVYFGNTQHECIHSRLQRRMLHFDSYLINPLMILSLTLNQNKRTEERRFLRWALFPAFPVVFTL